jgi:hypothetical protein
MLEMGNIYPDDRLQVGPSLNLKVLEKQVMLQLTVSFSDFSHSQKGAEC